jgi:hypothetical protein
VTQDLNAQSKIEYIASVTGHAAPFRWSLKARRNGVINMAQIKGVKQSEGGTEGGTTFREQLVNAEGTASTFDEALAEARAAAHEVEWERQHTTTVYEENVLEVELYDDIPTVDRA